MRIIARKTLRDFVESLRGSKDQKTVKSALDSANANIVGSDRVVFNITGNAYRLVVAVDHQRHIVYIKWLGTHAQYDKIDVKKVKYGD